MSSGVTRRIATPSIIPTMDTHTPIVSPTQRHTRCSPTREA